MRLHRSKSLRRTAVTGTVALAVTAGLVGLAAPASAAGKDGTCQRDELCLYWWQGYGEPLYDLYNSDSNFYHETFPRDHSKYVDDNTRSYWNRDTYYWRVYDDPDYSGEELACIEPGDRGNFSRGDWDRASSAYWSDEPC
jgi:hypothetical protein